MNTKRHKELVHAKSAKVQRRKERLCCKTLRLIFFVTYLLCYLFTHLLIYSDPYPLTYLSSIFAINVSFSLLTLSSSFSSRLLLE